MAIQFKNPDDKKDFTDFSGKTVKAQLRGLIGDLIIFLENEHDFIKPLIVTSLMRPGDNDSAHGHGRGVDIRAKDNYFGDELLNAIVIYLNTQWARKDGFKTAFAHGEGENFHLHVQIGG